jgi:hypothetical protein
MSYVDLIIKYLSGELSREETRAFERELESDAGLRKEFEQQSAAYELIRDQLQKRNEIHFREKLVESMSQEPREAKPRLKFFGPGWFIPLAVASSFAILFTILSIPNPQRVFARYFDPAKDPVVLAQIQDTRGASEPGIRQYRHGNFEQSMEELSVRIAEEEDSKEVMLYYLLSAIELDRQDEAMERITYEKTGTMDLADQALCWYSALALLKSGHPEAARETIHPLGQQQGPYRSRALKLEKVLLK